MSELKPVTVLKRSQFLMAMGTFCAGFLAGGNLDRYMVQVPAFRHVDIVSWAMYSRHADLGNGLLLYPLEAISGFVFFIVASVMVIMHRPILNTVARPVHAAAVLAALGLFLTIFAAPIMLGVGTMPNNPAQLHAAFERFHFWGGIRAVVQILSFAAGIWGMIRIFRLGLSSPAK